MENKQAVVLELGVRFQKEEHQLLPLFGWVYKEGYTYASEGHENLYALTEPLPQGTQLADDPQALVALGYTVTYLVEDNGSYKLEARD